LIIFRQDISYDELANYYYLNKENLKKIFNFDKLKKTFEIGRGLSMVKENLNFIFSDGDNQ
jgi:hypothetical protein